MARIKDDAIKDESLGHLWSDLPPSSDGYSFELAIELPFYLPNMENRPEYILRVDKRQYVICNRMIRAFFCDPSNKYGETEYYLVHRLGLAQLKKSEKVREFLLSPVPMKSFLSGKFVAHEKTAEQAIETNFASWSEDFFSGISSILKSIRSTPKSELNCILPISSPAFCPTIWVAITGQGEKSNCQQFAGNTGLVAHRSVANLNATEASCIRELLAANKPVAPFEDAISLANTFLFYSYLELAVIQVCTACESLISTAVRAYLKNRGVSQGTIDDQFSEVTYAELLNLFLPSILDIPKVQDYSQILGDLNWARKRRNEILHSGLSEKPLTPENVERAIRCAEKLATYIKAGVTTQAGIL